MSATAVARPPSPAPTTMMSNLGLSVEHGVFCSLNCFMNSRQLLGYVGFYLQPVRRWPVFLAVIVLTFREAVAYWFALDAMMLFDAE